MISDEEFILMDEMNKINMAMAEEIISAAPLCHFRKMNLEESDSVDGYYTQWWECSVCGHTKDLR